MRQVLLAAALVVTTVVGAGPLLAAPFEPATIPDRAGVVGHLDVDALRATQIFAAVGGQVAVDVALDRAPDMLRPVIHALSRAVRGVSFWRDADHGAVYLETRDSKSLGRLVGQLPAKPAQPIDGLPAYTLDGHDGGKTGFLAIYGDTLVLADSRESLELSVRVLGGKAANLAGSNAVPASSRQGVFVFVTIGDRMLGSIQKSARSKVLQLGLRSVTLDVSEASGNVAATARAEMRSADALQKARSIVEGVRAIAQLSDDAAARSLLDAMTVTSSGLTLEVSTRLPVAELARMIEAKK